MSEDERLLLLAGDTDGLRALTRALAESNAERDKLTVRVEKLQADLDLARTWIRLDPNDRAVVVAADGESSEGSWTAIFGDRAEAERFCEIVRRDDADVFAGGDAMTVLDGTVSAEELQVWNSFLAVKRIGSAVTANGIDRAQGYVVVSNGIPVERANLGTPSQGYYSEDDE